MTAIYQTLHSGFDWTTTVGVSIDQEGEHSVTLSTLGRDGGTAEIDLTADDARTLAGLLIDHAVLIDKGAKK